MLLSLNNKKVSHLELQCKGLRLDPLFIQAAILEDILNHLPDTLMHNYQIKMKEELLVLKLLRHNKLRNLISKSELMYNNL